LVAKGYFILATNLPFQTGRMIAWRALFGRFPVRKYVQNRDIFFGSGRRAATGELVRRVGSEGEVVEETTDGGRDAEEGGSEGLWLLGWGLGLRLW